MICKAKDTKNGYYRVEPLLMDVRCLEKKGVFVSRLVMSIKGIVFCLIVDNLGAHSIGLFLDNFTDFIWGTGPSLKSFSLRTKQQHDLHVQEALNTSTQCFGVKHQCAITDRLINFNVLTRYLPDVLHDLCPCLPQLCPCFM